MRCIGVYNAFLNIRYLNSGLFFVKGLIVDLDGETIE